MKVIKQINSRVSDLNIGSVCSIELRKMIFVGLMLFGFISTGAYVAFMVGTTVVAAERRNGLSTLVEMVAEVAEKEAKYVSLLDNVNRDNAKMLGFVPVDPSFVIRGSLGPGFTLSN